MRFFFFVCLFTEESGERPFFDIRSFHLIMAVAEDAGAKPGSSGQNLKNMVKGNFLGSRTALHPSCALNIQIHADSVSLYRTFKRT
ncbi:Uncharacterized protein TCM_016375 [Theobroma cacao]|uniref:Uncharacterized protein n=1 Tax=Theobroma cacao TaxID=3641 RepID=A0A061G5P1_THECC|nr:Uncharacterized protein TCM_016375 [Theobroma cacao]